MNSEMLINKGVEVFIPASTMKCRTIVVVGVARGGTSIVSGALHALGLPMGEKCYPPVFEDLRLSLAFEGRSDEHFSEVIAKYNEANPSWGWKRPSTLKRLDFISARLRNPHFIFVFRDIFSVANRNSISMKSDINDGLQDALNSYRLMIDFLQKTESPVMLVSSDKIVRHKNEFVEKLIDFAGVEASGLQRKKALNFISPDPQEYLDKTRITKSRGDVNVDLLKTGLLRGWARGVHHVNPVVVDVEVNGKKIASTEASIYREDLDQPSVHPTGECGYEIDLKTLGVTPTDIINVRVQDDVNPLNSKPIQYQDLERWLTIKEWYNQKQT
ncbi:sulfotransferase [Microbulbifer sp. SSSA008]|uniref:sulfotransferase n=1 Tax=Microbulbifer sp. SSSA008 TaxID=3243380 RepID=UPI004039AF2D